MPASFIDQRRGGDEEVKQKGHKRCKYRLEWPAFGRYVLIYSLLQSFTGGQGQDGSLNKDTLV